ncbi:hypothetical protein RQP46_010004 [Phenoliferia psychrophenolica]
MADFHTSTVLNQQHGPLVVALQVHLLLTGVFWCQSTSYFYRFSSSREPWQKGLVAVLLVIFVIKSVVDIIGLYKLLVSGFGDFRDVGRISTEFRMSNALSTLPALLSQLWLLLRVYHVSQRKVWLLCALAVPVLAMTVSGIAATYVRLHHSFESSQPRELRFLYPTWIYLTCGTNILLTGAFIYCIRLFYPEIVHPRLRERLVHLMSVSIQACAPTTICAVVVAILIRVSPNTSVRRFLTGQAGTGR